MKSWIALFSQTGSELKRLCDHFDVWPTQIITNNFDKEFWSKNIPEDLVTIMSADAIHSGLRYTKNKTFITLHGYLRIVPADVCEMHDIYNGHPGAINLYPELKGKDPQDRVWDNKHQYEFVGSVVHRVVPEVDAGEIVSKVFCENTCNTKEELYTQLKETSFKSWKNFLSTYFMREFGESNV